MDYITKLIENRKRNEKIVKLIEKGKSQADVARLFNMHKQQVNYIYKKAKNGNGTDSVGS
jgi:hypothetical protein